MIHSLQARLAIWLSAAIVMVAAVSGALSFYLAYEDAQESQDDILRQVAIMVSPAGLVEPAQPAASGLQRSQDTASRLIVQPLTRNPARPGALSLPIDMPDGLQTITLGRLGYRVIVRTLPDRQRIAVAQAIEVREELAQDSAQHTLLPLILLVPTLAIVAIALVRKALTPVKRLAREADGRREDDLAALDIANLPREVVPFVRAINRLLQRVASAMESQRRFLADAAHELRTPLAALSLQTERLAAAEMSVEAHARLDALRRGLGRTQHLLEQLLDLARAQSANRQQADETGVQTASVPAVYRRVLEDLFPLAEAKGIDIGMGPVDEVDVILAELDLHTVIRNLMDNAIRYTPAGGRVDLMAARDGNRVDLTVADDGPGIPAEQRIRVFDPFYRILGSETRGSGLGLSIVRTIVERAGGTVTLQPPDEQGRGLAVRVTLSTSHQDPRGPA